MSGGVDSSTAVWLLQQAGYDPVGFTMSLFSPDALPPDQRSQCHTARLRCLQGGAPALEHWLEEAVFAGAEGSTIAPEGPTRRDLPPL